MFCPSGRRVWKIEDAADGCVGRHGDAVVGRDKPRRHAENPPHRAAVGDDEERLARIFAGGGGEEVFDAFLAKKMPAFIFTHGLQPDEVFKEKAVKYQIPLLSTEQQTAPLIAEILRWLNVQLAPCKSMHGVLVDCYGVGVLLMGESGIGKSEAALELVKRGHRLVTDDVVEIHKVSEVTLVGTAPEITRNFIELRGVGVVDIKTLFGVQSVIETACIDLVIKLKEWDQEEDYDRLGLNDEYIEIVGNKVICHSIPIRPGRNLAVIVEAAAINYRQKKMGYNAAQELYKRVQDNLEKKRKPVSRIIDY